MRISDTDMAGLLTKTEHPTAPAKPKTQRPRQQRCGRDVARANELKCVKTVAHYGHVRVAELARAVWPAARFGEQVCRRVVRRLVQQGCCWSAGTRWVRRVCV